jgi:hypothetical protein
MVSIRSSSRSVSEIAFFLPERQFDSQYDRILQPKRNAGTDFYLEADGHPVSSNNSAKLQALRRSPVGVGKEAVSRSKTTTRETGRALQQRLRMPAAPGCDIRRIIHCPPANRFPVSACETVID